jgi:aspartyl-tRNA(Asn)/glutamyl-tRNA(Gln) amidotransferase subunit C
MAERISADMVRHVAMLARLELTDEEIAVFQSDMNVILEHAAQLEALDTSDVPPTSHSLPMSNVFRDDVVRPSLPVEEALANAADHEDGCFRVPAVIQDGGGA